MRGFAHILIILVIVAGMAVGLYLVQQKTHLLSQALTATPTQNSSTSPSIFDRLKARGNTPQNPTPTIAKTPSTSTPTPTPTPIKVGSIKGTIVGGYYSARLSNATIKANGQSTEKTAITDSSGNFTISGLPIGKYNLSFSHTDYTFSDWKDLDVKEGVNDLPRTPNGFLKIFKPTSVKGTVFVDHNNNSQKDSGDEGLNAILTIQNKLGDSGWNSYKTISVDSSGSFSFDIPDGSTYKIVPGEYTFYNKPNSTAEFVVDGYGGSKEFSFPYYPTASQAGFDIFAFNDKNENGIQDSGEENIDYYYAEVNNTSTGNTFKTSISASGTSEQDMDYATYNIKLVPGDSSWDYYYKITKRETQVTISNSSGKQTASLGAHKL